MSGHRALRDRARSHVTDRAPRASRHSLDRPRPAAIACRNSLEYRRVRSEERRDERRLPRLQCFVILVKICCDLWLTKLTSPTDSTCWRITNSGGSNNLKSAHVGVDELLYFVAVSAVARVAAARQALSRPLRGRDGLTKYRGRDAMMGYVVRRQASEPHRRRAGGRGLRRCDKAEARSPLQPRFDQAVDHHDQDNAKKNAGRQAL
jgi:hypothetical protein